MSKHEKDRRHPREPKTGPVFQEIATFLQNELQGISSRLLAHPLIIRDSYLTNEQRAGLLAEDPKQVKRTREALDVLTALSAKGKSLQDVRRIIVRRDIQAGVQDPEKRYYSFDWIVTQNRNPQETQPSAKQTPKAEETAARKKLFEEEQAKRKERRELSDAVISPASDDPLKNTPEYWEEILNKALKSMVLVKGQDKDERAFFAYNGERDGRFYQGKINLDQGKVVLSSGEGSFPINPQLLSLLKKQKYAADRQMLERELEKMESISVRQAERDKRWQQREVRRRREEEKQQRVREQREVDEVIIDYGITYGEHDLQNGMAKIETGDVARILCKHYSFDKYSEVDRKTGEFIRDGVFQEKFIIRPSVLRYLNFRARQAEGDQTVAYSPESLTEDQCERAYRKATELGILVVNYDPERGIYFIYLKDTTDTSSLKDYGEVDTDRGVTDVTSVWNKFAGKKEERSLNPDFAAFLRRKKRLFEENRGHRASSAI